VKEPLYKHKALALRILDRGGWKHSWHLPRTWTDVDWDHAETRSKVKEEVAACKMDGIRLIQMAQELEDLVDLNEPSYRDAERLDLVREMFSELEETG
jgi:hypothetical protein